MSAVVASLASPSCAPRAGQPCEPGGAGGGGGESAPFPRETPEASEAQNSESAVNLNRDVTSAGDSHT